MKTRSCKDAWGNEVKIVLGHGDALATTTLFTHNVLGQRTQVTDRLTPRFGPGPTKNTRLN